MANHFSLPSIWNKQQIQSVLDLPSCLKRIEEGLIAQAEELTISPPIGSLHFDSPPGDVHIKYGYIQGQDYYVIKVASGFYQNPSLNLPSSQGMMLVFKRQTGELEAILLDEGLLTDIRTALAGAICAKYLAPQKIDCIGILGTGTQALHQLQALQLVTSCRQVKIWGRNLAKAQSLISHPLLTPYTIQAVKTIEEITNSCQLIITTTPSSSPLLFGQQLLPGTHVTAIGADCKGKQELDASVLIQSDLVVVDSLAQCRQYGDLAYVSDLSSLKQVIELGQGLKNPALFARKPHWLTVADLTGVAVEDVQIAQIILEKLKG